MRAKLGLEALTLDTNPLKIKGKMRDARLRGILLAARKSRVLPPVTIAAINKCARATRPFNFSGARMDLVSFESGNTYTMMADIWANRDALKESQTFHKIATQLAKDGSFKHKGLRITNHAEIVPLLQTCFLDLLNSMAKDGYIRGKTSDHGTGGVGRALIWRDGSVWQENGATHRLAAAKLVGLNSAFPLRIVGAHDEWLTGHHIRKLSDLDRLPALLKSIDAAL